MNPALRNIWGCGLKRDNRKFRHIHRCRSYLEWSRSLRKLTFATAGGLFSLPSGQFEIWIVGSSLHIARNDAMEDRYTVLIKLNNQLAADGFYDNFNGKRFSPAEAEVCRILYVLSVDYTEEADIASTPPTVFTELRTCPICLGWRFA